MFLVVTGSSTSSIATTLINRAKALGQDILIDYDHQTLHIEKTGKEGSGCRLVQR
ncbi:phage protease [Aeromonas veronii]|uniref:phage protease n=1 Tax=Aeromonas veronii TaxID=654 RepID=UPI003F7A601F